MPVTEVSLNLYENLTSIQIGASALVNINDFISKTYEEKWWRWKRNRAIKQGYIYETSNPPHASAFLSELHRLSNNWLTTSNHQEQGFALGYFDKAYLQQCKIHYLKNQDGELVAFANQLPIFNNLNACTVDLMRYRADATDTMPYLLANIIKACGNENAQYFDLGFVPYAETKGSLLAIAQTLSSSRFSAKGLRQFKNKFKPEWQKVYLVHDGDLIDLGVIALQIESVMKKG
jgi:phosphatidylglycerol lysyltransferase